MHDHLVFLSRMGGTMHDMTILSFYTTNRGPLSTRDVMFSAQQTGGRAFFDPFISVFLYTTIKEKDNNAWHIFFLSVKYVLYQPALKPRKKIHNKHETSLHHFHTCSLLLCFLPRIYSIYTYVYIYIYIFFGMYASTYPELRSD